MTDVPEIDLTQARNAGVPVAMFAGIEDTLSTIEDNRWTRKQLTDDGKLDGIVVHYEELHADHMSFLIGRDMSFLERLLPVMKKYNPLPPNAPDYVFKAE